MSTTGINLKAVGAALLLIAAGLFVWNLRSPLIDSKPRLQKTEPVASGKERTIFPHPQSLPAYSSGQSIEVRSILNVPTRMRFGEYVWNDRSVPAGAVFVQVDLKAQLISVFRAGHEIGTAVILYGAENKQTPSGIFPILAKMKDHHSSLYDAEMPYTLRLTGDGISIHGSDVIWGRATHGCIGLPIEFAALLFAQVKVGDDVQIHNGKMGG